jgi:hypothetical protein
MDQPKAIGTASLGGGPGCKAIADMIFSERPSQLPTKLVGVGWANSKAVGYPHDCIFSSVSKAPRK